MTTHKANPDFSQNAASSHAAPAGAHAATANSPAGDPPAPAGAISVKDCNIHKWFTEVMLDALERAGVGKLPTGKVSCEPAGTSSVEAWGVLNWNGDLMHNAFQHKTDAVRDMRSRWPEGSGKNCVVPVMITLREADQP